MEFPSMRGLADSLGSFRDAALHPFDSAAQIPQPDIPIGPSLADEDRDKATDSKNNAVCLHTQNAQAQSAQPAQNAPQSMEQIEAAIDCELAANHYDEAFKVAAGISSQEVREEFFYNICTSLYTFKRSNTTEKHYDLHTTLPLLSVVSHKIATITDRDMLLLWIADKEIAHASLFVELCESGLATSFFNSFRVFIRGVYSLYGEPSDSTSIAISQNLIGNFFRFSIRFDLSCTPLFNTVLDVILLVNNPDERHRYLIKLENNMVESGSDDDEEQPAPPPNDALVECQRVLEWFKQNHRSKQVLKSIVAEKRFAYVLHQEETMPLLSKIYFARWFTHMDAYHHNLADHSKKQYRANPLALKDLQERAIVTRHFDDVCCYGRYLRELPPCALECFAKKSMNNTFVSMRVYDYHQYKSSDSQLSTKVVYEG